MEFYIYMCCMNLLIPIIMILFGILYSKKAPKKINYIYGYRTAMTMKNNDTWQFAHLYLGKIWKIIGFILFIVVLILLFFIYGKTTEKIGIYGGIICIAELVLLILTIIPAERVLRKNFNKDGNRIK